MMYDRFILINPMIFGTGEPAEAHACSKRKKEILRKSK